MHSISLKDALSLANQALSQYDLKDPTPEFIRHNENMTFRVREGTQGRSLLLRIHSPATTNFDKKRYTEGMISSELMWLDAIARDTDITVQKPIRSNEGKLVSFLAHSEQEEVPCSILEWIDGETLFQEANNVCNLAESFGRMLAKLHDHSNRWAHPSDFVRPAYETDYIRRRLELLRPGLQLGLFSDEEYRVLSETAKEVKSVLDSIGASHESWGLIHSDLQGGNVLVHEDDVRPIDFSLCGFGHLLFDFGVSVPCLKTEMRKPFLDGYARLRTLPREVIQWVEAFAIVAILSGYSFHIPNPETHDAMKKRIPIFARDYCRKFLDRKSFLFEI